MNEHRGTAFYNSCVKVPVDPYSRQPTPSYDRPGFTRNEKCEFTGRERRINFATTCDLDTSSPPDTVESFLDFLNSIPDYGQVHHLSNEQFRQKVDYLKRKQRLFLKNLDNSSLELSEENLSRKPRSGKKAVNGNGTLTNDLELRGRKCNLEESRVCSPILYRSGSSSALAEDLMDDLTTFRCSDRSDDKGRKTIRNNEIHSADKTSSTWRELKMIELEDNDTDSIETKSLPPPSATKEWHPTVPKPFSFTLREEAEKYMTRVEKEAEEQEYAEVKEKKCIPKKRRVRPIPLTSKIPLYEKLLAEKEERSRLVREESALNLLSQVRPFKLECERRAWKSFARSNPELRGVGKAVHSGSKCFRAKPVPKNLFGTGVYDRMLEDEYYRHLKKKVRAAELMKSSALPPSMARRERVKSSLHTCQDSMKDSYRWNDSNDCIESIGGSSRLSTYPSNLSLLGSRGTNLAAILRCQASREKLERELREEMEEKRRENATKIRESMIGRKPVWRALRSAARHEHERDLSIRTSLRRDEAREQAERHRLQMEMMLDRVTLIPTLFERHSQTYRTLSKMQEKVCPRASRRKTRKSSRKLKSDSVESYSSFASNSGADSGSLTSSSDTGHSHYRSSKSSFGSSQALGKSVLKSEAIASKRKAGDRGQLKVSINETAQLIEDNADESSSESQVSREDDDDDDDNLESSK